ncbi:hypothetical protein QTI66_31715 [Variovorax sp. J22R133]|uniref:hypothetical protein n=1 Tax=Variovorax brevis TaxID=3053503 RepID=UPI002577EFB8|nr:hypothetical protein [Variovorax sp. J22R133]MDM0116708.1 hypothetical protein [Variovorax sp. J22R133]
MLAVEVLDAVTLERVTQGLDVIAQGIAGKPFVNHSGLFVWVKQDATKFTGLTIVPFSAPFERVELTAAQLDRPIHSVQLHPLPSYPFAPGDTAIRGRLVESDNMPPQVPRVPISGATMRFEWLDDDGVTWHAWLSPRVTTASGDFTAMVRFARGLQHADGSSPEPDEPRRDVDGNLSIRVTAKRATGPQKQHVYPLAQGRVTDKTFAWDSL